MVVIIVGTLGCATLSEKECLQGDWKSIGYQDGTRGHLLNRFEQHREACADLNISPDFEAYKIGHQEGLTVYCEAGKGFELGEQVKDYNGVCPNHLEAAFLEQYMRGLETTHRFVLQDIKAEENELYYKERLLINIENQEERNKIKEELKTLNSKINSLNVKHRDIIRRLEKARAMKR